MADEVGCPVREDQHAVACQGRRVRVHDIELDAELQEHLGGPVEPATSLRHEHAAPSIDATARAHDGDVYREGDIDQPWLEAPYPVIHAADEPVHGSIEGTRGVQLVADADATAGSEDRADLVGELIGRLEPTEVRPRPVEATRHADDRPSVHPGLPSRDGVVEIPPLGGGRRQTLDLQMRLIGELVAHRSVRSVVVRDRGLGGEAFDDRAQRVLEVQDLSVRMLDHRGLICQVHTRIAHPGLGGGRVVGGREGDVKPEAVGGIPLTQLDHLRRHVVSVGRGEVEGAP